MTVAEGSTEREREARIGAWLDELSQDEKDLILGGNAARLLML